MRGKLYSCGECLTPLYQDSRAKIWGAVPGALGYRVSIEGDIESCWQQRGPAHGFWQPSGPWVPLTKCKDSDGYYVVKFGKDASVRKVHRIVAEAFIAPVVGKKLVCHCNGIRTDNRKDNLKWGTPADNSADMVAHGNSLRGDKNPMRVKQL